MGIKGESRKGESFKVPRDRRRMSVEEKRAWWERKQRLGGFPEIAVFVRSLLCNRRSTVDSPDQPPDKHNQSSLVLHYIPAQIHLPSEYSHALVTHPEPPGGFETRSSTGPAETVPMLVTDQRARTHLDCKKRLDPPKCSTVETAGRIIGAACCPNVPANSLSASRNPPSSPKSTDFSAADGHHPFIFSFSPHRIHSLETAKYTNTS